MQEPILTYATFSRDCNYFLNSPEFQAFYNKIFDRNKGRREAVEIFSREYGYGMPFRSSANKLIISSLFRILENNLASHFEIYCRRDNSVNGIKHDEH